MLAPFRGQAKYTHPRRHFTELAIVGAAATAATAVGALALAGYRYKVARADQYLVRTGLGIPDVRISKQGMQWPFQTYQFIGLQPINYSFELQAMTSEKMEFLLPGVFTIGPKDDLVALIKYARTLMTNNSDQKHTQIDALVKGVLEGEVRILSAQLTVEEIFNDRKAFKDRIIREVQSELDQFGLIIYNANIKELQDSPGSEYFSYIRQKKRSEAENRAKIDVSEAKKTGDISQKEREAETRQQVAQYESEAVKKENLRKQEVAQSKADLQVIEYEAFQRTEMAKIQTYATTKMKEAELQKEVEQKRVVSETEKLRAVEMSKAQVAAETKSKAAEGEASAMRIKADAELYSKVKAAEGEASAMQIKADAQLYSKQKEAEAQLYSKQKEANGIYAVLQAQAQGVEALLETFGTNHHLLIQYLMLEKNLYQDLAATNAQAIQGLNPKITIWNTTSDGKDSTVTKPIADIMKMLPPLLTTINDQTGIKPADWLMNLPKSVDKTI